MFGLFKKKSKIKDEELSSLNRNLKMDAAERSVRYSILNKEADLLKIENSALKKEVTDYKEKFRRLESDKKFLESKITLLENEVNQFRACAAAPTEKRKVGRPRKNAPKPENSTEPLKYVKPQVKEEVSRGGSKPLDRESSSNNQELFPLSAYAVDSSDCSYSSSSSYDCGSSDSGSCGGCD